MYPGQHINIVYFWFRKLCNTFQKPFTGKPSPPSPQGLLPDKELLKKYSLQYWIQKMLTEFKTIIFQNSTKDKMTHINIFVAVKMLKPF